MLFDLCCDSVIGPRCVMFCLLNKLPIPKYGYPLHNMAMYNVVATCTRLSVEQKAKVKKMVEYMAGVYCNDFHMGVTHLIAESVDSEKYRVSGSAN